MSVPTSSPSLNPGEYPRRGGPRGAPGNGFYLAVVAPLLLAAAVPYAVSLAWESIYRDVMVSGGWFTSMIPLGVVGLMAGFVVYGVGGAVAANRRRGASSFGAVFFGIVVGVVTAAIVWNEYQFEIMAMPFPTITIWGVAVATYLVALLRSGRPGPTMAPTASPYQGSLGTQTISGSHSSTTTQQYGTQQYGQPTQQYGTQQPGSHPWGQQYGQQQYGQPTQQWGQGQYGDGTSTPRS